MSRKPPKRRRSERGASASDGPRSPIALIRDIQSAALDPTLLDQESRRTCVEHLLAEGYNAAEIAEVLKVTARTIYRDQVEIRRANAIQRDPALVDEFIGDLVQQARQSVARLRRLSRERDCPHAARIEAERGAWSIVRESTEVLQRLGILPTAAQEIRADLTHRLEGPPDLGELQAQAETLERVLRDAGRTDPEMADLLSIREGLGLHRAGKELRVIEASLATAPTPDPLEGDEDGVNA